MKKNDYAVVLVLFFFMLFIWLRDLSWISTSDDTVPILVSLPLFLWLGAPWSFRDEVKPLSRASFVWVVVLSLLGILLDVTLLLAIAWTLLLWTWLKKRIIKESYVKVRQLLIFPIMAFPWVALDMEQISWWFRLSGAWVTGTFFQFLGYDVVQEGTNLTIDQLPIAVEAACAGLNTLQSMLIAGSVVNVIFLGGTTRYWYNILTLIAISWIANTLRIIGICIAALVVSPAFALEVFHNWGGWAVLVVMFALCWAVLSFQDPCRKGEKK